uniref:DUF3741 domain-containing protein n=1 Tax=Oryza rufipogon TaxID=4529 RepID=A0A0E0P1Y6_ORYRU
MAKVPDLGSDFAQKLLLDLRRRRERLGFDSPAPPQRTSSSNAAVLPRDSHSSSQRPHRSQKPQQAAPRAGRAEATANRSHPQSGNAIAGAGKPRHRATPVANSHQIVPFQGGGSAKQKPANSSIDVQMALAIALSNRGKLQNIELVSRNGSIFFRDTDHAMPESHLVSPSAHVGKVAIGVKKLNDILMAYSSGGGARDTGRRSSVDIGRELFGGAMDLEESLSMLVMLQEASDYMEGSGNGKVLLLEGKENLKNSARSPSSARLVEIVDEDSEAEQAKNSKSLSMQIVPHKNSQGFSTPNSSSVLQVSTVTGNNSRSNSSKADKDDAKVRMPNVIAKLMGLDNLPSTKVANKGMEKFVKPEALSRKDRRTNLVGGRLPIQIIGSERVSSKGHNMNLLPGEWKIGLKNYEVYKSANLQVSNSSSIPAADKQTRQTMRQMLSKMENAERRGSLGQQLHEEKKLTEETNQQKVANVGCRTDAGKKMDFLKRIRKISGSRQVTEEKHIIQEESTTGKKQTTSMKQLLGTDSEDKSKITRVKFNKENLATTEIKNAARGKNGKTDQRKRQSYNKQTDVHSMPKKSQKYREMKSKEGIQNLEHKRSTKSEATQLKILPYTAEIQQENGKHEEDNDIVKPSDSHGDGGISEQFAGMVEDSRTTGMASPDQFMKQITEVTSIDVHASDRSNVVDQSVTQTNDDTSSNTASETTQTPETFTEGEHHQNLQLVEFKEKPLDDLGDAKETSNPTDLQDQKMHVVSCDSFTENQLLLMRMLLKDQYLLETAKALVRNPVPVHFVNASADRWSEKGSSLFSDIAREVIRKKGKRTEATVEVSMANTTNMKLQYLDDLIMELDGDIESLNISKKSQHLGEDCTAENLRMILHRDMQNNHPDANSMWDFGWNRISDLPIERNEVVRDLEKNILGGMITDVARELIELSVRHGCCACEA